MNYCPFNTIGCREMVLDGAMEIVFGQMASVSHLSQACIVAVTKPKPVQIVLK